MKQSVFCKLISDLLMKIHHSTKQWLPFIGDQNFNLTKTYFFCILQNMKQTIDGKIRVWMKLVGPGKCV